MRPSLQGGANINSSLALGDAATCSKISDERWRRLIVSQIPKMPKERRTAIEYEETRYVRAS
jgi:hypothetical protein